VPDIGVGVFGRGMEAQLAVLRRAAATAMPVLITGETGTGKELVAREIHRLSRRAAADFVPLNCAAVPRDMLESQLFGHRRGAFTGAAADFGGVVQAAAGGTLFLDEIGDLALDLQPKLLRFLESGEVHRLGEPRPTTVEVRTVAATNASIERLVSSGGFREDLFYRLNVMRLHLPPLRERRDDVPALVRHFLDRAAQEVGLPPVTLSASAGALLEIYDWPGNVRELLNEMRRLVAFSNPGEEITPRHLSPVIRARRPSPGNGGETIAVDASLRLDEATALVQRALVARAMRESEGQVTEAAARLGVSRKGLFLMRKRLNLD
jgi:DNA-binding NtrC family response regulator